MSLEPRLQALQSFLDSWTTADGKLRGVVVTYWDQQLEPIEHVMHYYPLILAYIRQHQAGRRFGAVEPLDAARRMGDRLVSLQEASGLFGAAWGDIPPKRTGPVLQAAPAYALARLYQVTGETMYLDSAFRAYEKLKTDWWDGITLRNYVVNQTSTFVALLVALYQIEPSDRLRKEIEQNIAWILDQQRPNGGFPQAYHSLRMFLVYNAKSCIGLLAALESFSNTGYTSAVPEALRQQAHFLLNHLYYDADGPMFVSHVEPVAYPYPLYLQIYRAAKLLPKGQKIFYRICRNVPYTAVRRWPIWIARSALIIDVLHQIAEVLNDDTIRAGVRHTARTLLRKQYLNGAFPNAIGFRGNLQPTWYDVAAPVRWNVYAYLLLSDLCLDGVQIDLPEFLPEEAITVPFMSKKRAFLWHEDRDHLILRSATGNSVWQFEKRF